MARPLWLVEKTLLRLPPGSFARIDAVLNDGENKATFIRRAISKEIRQREKAAKEAMAALPAPKAKAKRKAPPK